MSIVMFGIDLLLAVVSLLALVPAAVVFVQICASRSAPRDPPGRTDGDMSVRPRLAVLMPAHDEAAGIAPSIRAILPELREGDRLLVVADNCSDETAAIARACGAEVIEREDRLRRGKGYALDHGVRWLERDPPDVVVIVDADCMASPRSLAYLAAACVEHGRPAQALYLMHAPEGAPLGMRIAEFAWIVKNKARPLGGLRLGWPCQLMGTGMAFPWPLIRHAPLASSDLVEDMQLGLDLAGAGTPPLFCPAAQVSSMFPVDADGARSQRTRWEHGHLMVIARVGPRLLAGAAARRDARLLAMALDLMVPPLASLVLSLCALLAIDLVWWWAAAGSVVPLTLSMLATLTLFAAMLIAWRAHGREAVSARELWALPVYVARKVPMYIRLFTRRQVEWVRTKRGRTDG